MFNVFVFVLLYSYYLRRSDFDVLAAILGFFREGPTGKITYVPKYHYTKNGAFIRSVTIRVKYDAKPLH